MNKSELMVPITVAAVGFGVLVGIVTYQNRTARSPLPESSSSAAVQPAVLVGRNPDDQINIRAEASLTANVIAQGVPGDRVTVLDQTQVQEGGLWYYVKFENANIQGWVNGNLIRFIE